MSSPLPRFSRRDVDGFFGLWIDNLVQLLVAISFFGMLAPSLRSFVDPDEWLSQSEQATTYLLDFVLPGAAVSVLFGNLFYAWQARRLAEREHRSDVTALPYGINTPSLIVFFLFVILPVTLQTGRVETGWKAGLVACFGSGLIELAGAPLGSLIRRGVPRAALLATLAGIAVGFISMGFVLDLYMKPLVGLAPLVVVLTMLLARVRFAFGLSGGLVALILGTGTAWLLTAVSAGLAAPPDWLAESTMDVSAVRASLDRVGLHLPRWCGGLLWEELSHPERWAGLLSIIVPMGLFNVIGSLQNLESAEAAGDRYEAGSSMSVNGLGTIAAACFGSCFPTTIYIGHPGWKSLGAGAGYSTLNGLVITAMALTGVVGLMGAVVPVEAGAGIVLWIGVIITSQAFDAVPGPHRPAVALALFPAIAAFGMTVMSGTFVVADGTTVQAALEAAAATKAGGFSVGGLILMERGYILTCLIWGAVAVALCDRKFWVTAAWLTVAAVLTWLGVLHAHWVSENVIGYWFRWDAPPEGAWSTRADGVALGYLMAAGFAATQALRRRGAPDAKAPSPDTALLAPRAPSTQGANDAATESPGPSAE